MDQHKVIRLSLDTSREKDKGKTPNYHVYAAAETFIAKNGKGQDVTKNAVMGGNGTVYIANSMATGIDAWVLVPAATFDDLAKNATLSPASLVAAATKPSKKKR